MLLQPKKIKITKFLTSVFSPELAADWLAHIVESMEVFCQGIIMLPVKSCQSTESVPLKPSFQTVEFYTKCRHCTIEICLLSSWPPTVIEKKLHYSVFLYQRTLPGHMNMVNKVLLSWNIVIFHSFLGTDDNLFTSWRARKITTVDRCGENV